MSLSIKVPPAFPQERAYIVDVLFRTFLGLDYRMEVQDRKDTLITLDGSGSLILPDILFGHPREAWLRPGSLPGQPLARWDARELGGLSKVVSPDVPVIYGQAGAGHVHASRAHGVKSVVLPIDILGSAFFMLARYEEAVKAERDPWGRFPAHASLAHQEGFLDRPIVNEYLEILWQAMISLWPGLKRRRRDYRLFLTHDVDIPLVHGNTDWALCLRGCVGDVARRRSLLLAGQRLVSRFERLAGKYDNDPFNTFDYIMTVSEKAGIRSAFYFMCGADEETVRERYDIRHPWIRELFSGIHARGHEVGLHPTQDTYRDFEKTKAQFDNLLSLCSELGIRQSRWGGRQHRLQWENPTTWRIWDRANLDYDSTLSFAEEPGFRCGVCYEYPVFDLFERRELRISERPLIVMEGSLFSYMKVSLRTAAEVIRKLQQRCRAFGGDFVFLCHNSKLISRGQKRWYEGVIEAIR